jgi:predicted nucleic acid-binding protein
MKCAHIARRTTAPRDARGHRHKRLCLGVHRPRRCRDSEDDYLVALADSSDAGAIVSLDRDLLEAGLTIRCLTPTDFLVSLESPPSAT